MYYNDDYPCGRCPYNEPAYGHCDYDEYCRYEDEEMEQQYYLDTCDDDDEDDVPDDYEADDTDDAPSSIVIIPRPADDVDDLPFLSITQGIRRPRLNDSHRPRLSSHDLDDCAANEGEEDDDYDPNDYPEDDDEDEEYEPDDYADYYDDEYYDLDDDPLKTASSPKAIIPLDDYLF